MTTNSSQGNRPPEDHDFDVGASSTNDLTAYTDLLFWLDQNLGDIPVGDLVDRGYISPDNRDVDVFNLIGASLTQKRSLFKAGNIQKNQRRSTIIRTWLSLISIKEKKERTNLFHRENFTKEWIGEFVKLSADPENVNNLKEILGEIGIVFLIEESFNGLGIDGVVFINDEGSPVIGHSVRFDRYDNFWFTLLHELSHVFLHYENISEPIVEDLEDQEDANDMEKEANYFATNLVVPNSIWRRCDVIRKQTPESVYALAKKLEIHPALIAGKFRFENNRFDIFSDITNIKIKEILET